jgi:hypothetical protein
MRLVLRGAVIAAALATLTSCGGSVADADDREPTRPTRAPVSPFCAAAQANSEAIRPLNSLVARGSVPPAELANTVEAVRRTGSDLISASPPGVRPDVERTVQAVNLQLDALLAAGGDAAAATTDPALVAQLESPELAAAGERYRSYVVRNCGVAR